MPPRPPTLRWQGETEGRLLLLDQTLLPDEMCERTCRTAEDVCEAIRTLRVRGAPAIGIAAAYGVVLGAAAPCRSGDLSAAQVSTDAVQQAARKTGDFLATSRPTAVNLFWALRKMRSVIDAFPTEGRADELLTLLLEQARAIHEDDRKRCAAIGRHGAARLSEVPDGGGVLTHCNAGALATGGDGTALSVLFAMHAAGKRFRVFAGETRPLLQGARLTTWELLQRGMDTTLICDSAAAHLMQSGRIHAVITGADRIAANGDTANKIGTYSLALAAAAHRIPFFVAAPVSTFDRTLASGDSIPIEERPESEVTHCRETAIAPERVNVFNPAFDVTPARLIQAIICEEGVIEPVSPAGIQAVFPT